MTRPLVSDHNKEMTDDCCSIEVESKEQARVLWMVLGINAAMFVAEFIAGVIAQSTGLIADSLDMLADAAVYCVSLYAVGRSANLKNRAATLSGVLQILLAVSVAGEILRRTIMGSEPEPTLMIGVSLIALVANVMCLALIAKHRDGEVHMRASWVFSKNDVIANVGVIAAGGLVLLLDAHWPDLVIGALIVFVVLRGGISILADAKRERMIDSQR
jgi:cation diffusion facilitator family transporter